MGCFCYKADKDTSISFEIYWPASVPLFYSEKSNPVCENGGAGVTLEDGNWPIMCCSVVADAFLQVMQLRQVDRIRSFAPVM